MILRSFILILIFLFPCLLFSQEPRKVDISQLVEIEGINYHKGESVSYTGECFGRFETGEKGVAGSYDNGKRNGEWIWWYKNGNKKRFSQFKDGLKHGKTIFWYKSGIKKSEMSFENDKNVNQQSWDEKGKLTTNPVFIEFK